MKDGKKMSEVKFHPRLVNFRIDEDSPEEVVLVKFQFSEVTYDSKTHTFSEHEQEPYTTYMSREIAERLFHQLENYLNNGAAKHTTH